MILQASGTVFLTLLLALVTLMYFKKQVVKEDSKKLWVLMFVSLFYGLILTIFITLVALIWLPQYAY